MAPTSATIITPTRAIHHHHHRRHHQKIVVIMGPTGSGKSKLSIDLATRFFPSEIINSDKIQVYKGLDITTNKISMRDRKGVPHHLLGEFQPSESTPEFSPSAFRSRASEIISQIISRRKLPLIVGGSNSFIYSLLSKRFDPELDVFEDSNSVDSVCSQLRFDCCFIWVDVDLPVLNEYLDKRVDEMLDSGMLEELEEFFASESHDSVSQSGIKKAIGVPEFEKFFKNRYCFNKLKRDDADVAFYEQAVKSIKDNTWILAKRQQEKIQRLRDAGWDLHKIDATEAFRAAMAAAAEADKVAAPKKDASIIWESQVVQPSVKIVKQFLME